MSIDKVIFKAFLPYADVIESVSDERGFGDGIWIYPIRSTRAAEAICSPGQLHEYTVRELLPQLREVAAEIRTGQSKWGRGYTSEELAQIDAENGR